MTEFERVAQTPEQEEVDLAASDRVPSIGDWGFSYWGDAPPAIGGGQAWFMWFESKEACLAYLRDRAA
jgi:hypothetical protein